LLERGEHGDEESDDDDESYCPSMRGETADDGTDSEEEDDVPWDPLVLERDPDSNQDLLGQVEHEADRRLIDVYGDTVHQNDGRHLHGGVEGDETMQMLYDKVVSYPQPLYSPPNGKIGQRFLRLFAKALRMVQERKSNSERALLLPCVILWKDLRVKRAQNIKSRLERQMDLWEGGSIAELVQDTVATAMRGAGGSQASSDDDIIAIRYHSMVIEGKLWAAVQSVSNRDSGGVLQMEDHCTKATGKTVIKVLRSKHPDLIIPRLD
jgi:hypothetical protein